MSQLSTREVRFDERLGPLFLGIVFFGGIVVWMAWEMFVRGGRPEMNSQFLNPTTDNPLSWFVVVAGSFMVLLGLWTCGYGSRRCTGSWWGPIVGPCSP